jgi:putative flippase GtrA
MQAIISVELNFACNKLFNWRDRKGALFSQWLRFHTTKVGTILLNQLLFGFLVAHGIYYLLATLIGVALATIINYVINDKFVFIPGKVAAHVDKPV